jgi:hypothetical protein
MFKHAYPVPLEQHPSPARLPQLHRRRKLLREVQSGEPVTAVRPKRRPKGGGTPVQRICSTEAGEAATVLVVDDDPSVLRALSRLTRAAGFKTFDPAKRVARERNSESQRVYGGRCESSREEWKRTVQRAGSIRARSACDIDHWPKRRNDVAHRLFRFFRMRIRFRSRLYSSRG